MTNLAVTKKQVSEYYENHFKIMELARLINVQLGDFERREFAWFPFPDYNIPFRRNVRFQDFDAFREKIVKAHPFKLYHGAVFQQKWFKTTIGVPWERNELHFDIDVTESEMVRKWVCDCGSSKDKKERKKMCEKCLEISKESAIFLVDTMEEDFGLKKSDSLIYFSGTRGMHVHYPKISKIGFDEEEEKEIRRNLISYISIVDEAEAKVSEKKTKIVANISEGIESRTMKNRIDRLVYKWFFLKGPNEAIEKAKISSAARKELELGFKEGKTMTEILKNYSISTGSSLMTNRQVKRLVETALTYRYPRFDGSPTHDVRKVIKVPLSIDCNTGYIVSKIKDLEGFTLGDVDHVLNYVK